MKKLFALLFLAVLLMPVAVYAQSQPCQPGMTPSTQVCDATGLGNIQGLIGRVVVAVGAIAGTLALGMLIYSGFRMLVSQGEPEGLKMAKGALTWAIIGIVVSCLSFVIVVAFQNFIGLNPAAPGSEANNIINPLTSPDIQSFIVTVIQNFLAIVGVLAVVMIIVNGFRYVVAAGNEEMIKKAKSGLIWSIGGFITVVLSYAILAVINNLLP
jgi:hypothetical protein